MSRHGELGEFTDFVTGYQGKMVRLTELLTGDRGRAEDLAQHGFAKAYAAWDRIRGGDPAAHVRRCIINANTDWWRRRVRYEQPSPQVPEVFTHLDLPAAAAARDLVALHGFSQGKLVSKRILVEYSLGYECAADAARPA